MKFEMNKVAKNFKKDPHGIWVGENEKSISYPDQGHSSCFQIEENSFWFNHRNSCIKTVIDLYPPQGEIWDVGGGNGFVTRFLQSSGFEAVLIEPGRLGAMNGFRRGVKHVICGQLSKDSFQPSTLSSVGLFDVIEHIENDSDFLKTIHHLLKPEGKVYLTTPAYQFLWSAEDVFAGHFRRYTKSTLSDLFLKNGFKLRFVSYFFFFLPIPIFLLRALPFKLTGKKIESSNVEGDHQAKSPKTSETILKILGFEIAFFRQKISLPFGGSLIAVAEKIN